MEQLVEDPWRDNLACFILDAASVTIMPADGEITARHGLRLSVAEGRQEELRDDERGRPAPSTLAYFMRVGIADAPAPDLLIGTDARVVISGRHRNGSMVTVAGAGVVGWDDAARLEVEFTTPPQMSAEWPEDKSA